MIRQEFSVGQSVELDVRIQSGRVEVHSGDPGVVLVEVDTSDPGFVVDQRGDLIYISSDKNSSWLSRNSAFVRIEVPDKADAVIGTASAKIECTAPLGRIDAKTASGEIEIDTAGSIVIKTASGDAQIRLATGDIKVSSASGDVHVGTFEGKANFSAASGDLVVNEGSGSIVASTASGDISIDRFSGQRANLKTMSGTASIGVPAGTKLDLDVTLLSGNLNLPKPSAAKTESQRQMSITAKLVSGDLNIRRA